MKSRTSSPPVRWFAAVLAGSALLLVSGCEGDEGPKGDPGDPADPGSTPEETELTFGEDAPGIHVDIVSVDGASGGDGTWQVGDTVRVTFTVKKDDGSDWASLAEFNSGRAVLSGPTFNYQRVLPEESDVRAAAVDNGDGTWTYTFADPIPAAYVAPYNDTTAFGTGDGELTGQSLLAGTYTLAVYFRWGYTVEGQSERDQGEGYEDLLFLGATTVVQREVVKQENCNNCHSDLRAHGTNRKGVTLCLMCHTSGSEDDNDPLVAGGTPGVSVDFRVMIHKIHNGAHLPSVNGVATNPDGSRNYGATPVPYEVAGFSLADFSGVAFPAWPNLNISMPRDAGYSGLTSGEQAQETAILQGVTNCAICHGDPDGAGPVAAPAQGDLAYAQPTRRACGSCHDDVHWDQPYTANTQTMPAQSDDSACTLCHEIAGTGLDVVDAHVHPLLNPALNPGLNFEITSVDEAGANDGDGTFDPGERIEVTFDLVDDLGGAVDASTLASMNLALSGPTDNLQTLLYGTFPTAVLTGSPPYTVNLPEARLLEFVGDSTGATGDLFPTLVAPHWNVSGATTAVWLRTATAGGSSTLAEACDLQQNYLDLADATGFARDEYVVVDDGTGLEEYLRIQFVDGDRIWFSSPYSSGYVPGTRVAHAAGATVDEVTLTSLVAGVDYSLDALNGIVTELVEFGTGSAVVVDYTADYVVPDVYPIPFNDSPDLGDDYGEWRGKSLVDGTYTVGLWGYRNAPLALWGESQTYRGTSPLGSFDILVGDASSVEPYDLISSAGNCYACHQDIYFHGAGRRGVETCVICHGTAGAEDRPQYVAAGAPATTGVQVSFREMLHKIHHGEELAQASTYTVVGFGQGYPNNFSEHHYGEVVFPAMDGGTKNCTACHGDGNDAWTAPANRDHPTEQELPVKEWRMVCGSCHDDEGATAHMGSQSDPVSGLEACTICHGPGDELAVELVHKTR